jgi:hypothetical protein
MCFIDKVRFLLNYLLFEEPCAKKHKVPSTKGLWSFNAGCLEHRQKVI